MSRGWSRRELLRGAAAAAGAAALAPLASLGGCRAQRLEPGSDAPGPEDDASATRGVRRLPLLEVAGEPYAVGTAIGKRFTREFRTFFARRRPWFDDLARFAENEGRPAFEAMLQAARRHVPEPLEELRGLADGSGLPLRELQVLNARSELEAAQRTPLDRAGCSTLVAAGGAGLLLAHNEDGDTANEGLMYLVQVRPRSGVAFLALGYPGVVLGNGPALNDRGLAMITNFIGTVAWRPGIPRYLLDRWALEATSIDDAVARVLHDDRAYSFHHVLARVEHGRPRAVAVEATPTRAQLRELDGVYVHTNHLVLEDLRAEPQLDEYVSRSSRPRYTTLHADLADVADPGILEIEDLVAALSSHAGRPYSPCRHPEGDVRGATLACAVFDLPRGRLRLYPGNPCRGGWAEYLAPEAEAFA
jgi:predicted choloylglycine hydrolase